MKKPKKITVKPFLNDKLEAIEVSIHDADTGEDSIENHYPLYYMVIYNRNNTKFKSRLGFYYNQIEDVPTEMINYETQIIEKTLRYLIFQNGGEIDLKGLGSEVDKYGKELFICIEDYLKYQLRLAALSCNSKLSFILDYKDWRNSFIKYYEVALKIFDNISEKFTESFKSEIQAYKYYVAIKSKENSKPTIIDWLHGDYKTILSSHLGHEKDRKSVFALIEKTIKKAT